MTSTSFIDYNAKRTINPRINFDDLSQENTDWIYQQEPSNLLFYLQNFNSYSNSSMSVNVNSIPTNVCVERRADIRCKIQLVLRVGFKQAFLATTPTPQQGADILINYVAPRAYPLQSSCTNLNFSINGLSFIYQPNVWADQLTRFYDHSVNQIKLSAFPSYHDPQPFYTSQNQIIDYPLNRDSVNRVAHRGQYCTFAPIGTYYNSGVYTPDGAITNNTLDVLMTIPFTESLIAEPLCYKNSDKEVGFLQLKNMNIQMTFLNLFQNMISANLLNSLAVFPPPSSTNTLVVPQSNTGGILSQWVNAPVLMLKQYNLPVNDIYNLSNSLRLIYPYNQINQYNAGQNIVLAPNASTMINYSFSISNVPSKIYIFSSDTMSTINTNINVPSSCMGLTPDATGTSPSNLQITFNQNPSVLQSASLADIFNVASELGYNGNFQSWKNSSIIALDTSYLCLPANMCRGVQQTINVTINLNWTNYSEVTRTIDMYVICITPGSVLVENSNIIVSQGIIDISPMLSADTPYLSPAERCLMNAQERTFYAGSFLEKLKTGSRKALELTNKYLPKAIDAAEKYGPSALKIAKQGAKALPLLLGLGYTRVEAEEMIKRASGMSVGGLALGGAAVPMDKLQSRLSGY